MWVLTESYNDYNQHGAYFVAGFSRKPSRLALANALNEAGYNGKSEEFLDHVMSGGGRQGIEDCWLELKEHPWRE